MNAATANMNQNEDLKTLTAVSLAKEYLFSCTV